MKKQGRKLLVGTLSLVFFACSCLTGFAEGNTAKITKVTVTDAEGGSPKEYTEGQMTDIVVKPDQLIKVEVTMSGSSAEDLENAEATFLAFKKDTGAEGLNNDTIHYIDQDTVETETESGTVTFTYRPRTGDTWLGEFTAKAGGTGVTEPNSVNYTVKKADVAMTLTAKEATVTEGDGKDATFTLAGYEGDQAGLTVMLEETPLTQEEQFTYAEGTLTVKNAAFSDKAHGTYTVKVSAQGYIEASASLTIQEKAAEVIPDEDKGAVEEALAGLDEVSSNPETNEVQLPELKAGDGGKYKATYSITEGDDDEIELTPDNKVKYTPDPEHPKFAHRVVVKASFGNGEEGEIAADKVLYFVKEGATLSFGNVYAMTAGDGGEEDAFASQENLKNADEGMLLQARTEALNAALGRGDKGLAKPADTLNYNHDGKISLAEYRILKMMIANRNLEDAGIFKVDNVRDSRPAK